MPLTCTNCGSSELESDASRGDIVCTKCGAVVEDNIIVSEVQFEESRGASHIVGQMISNDTSFKGLSMGTLIGSGKESREITLINTKRKIREVGAHLKLNNHCIETAFNFYKMALIRRLTHGRKSSHVIAACIYITCRTESTSHMLLDLSDITQVNVYDLGRTYLKLSSSLCINIPAIDPCIYIVRFAHKLELAEKTHDVEMTALRLVQRMKRDWMHTGRRPSGLCGAAILVAARLHNINCSIKDVIKIVKVCETTIRKRLTEFGDTPTSRLTLDEFMTVDLEGEEDPPCYKAARKKLKQLDECEKLPEIQSQITKLQEQIDKSLEEAKKKIRAGPYAKYAKLSNDNQNNPVKVNVNSDETIDDETLQAEVFIEEETLKTVRDIVESNDQLSIERDSFFAQVKALRPTAASLGLTDSFGFDIPSTSSLNITLNKEKLKRQRTSSIDNQENDDSDGDEEVEIIEKMEDTNGELELDDIDDDEIDSYLLTEAEIKAKTNMWHKIHAEYLKEVAEKEKQKLADEEERKQREASGELPPKKKRKSKKKTNIQANTAGEAIEMMLQEKRISNKINYEVLKRLNSNSISNNDTNAKDSERCIRNDNDDEQMLSSSISLSTSPSSSTTARTMIKANNKPGSDRNSSLRRLPSMKNMINNSTSNSRNTVLLTKLRQINTKLSSTNNSNTNKMNLNNIDQVPIEIDSDENNKSDDDNVNSDNNANHHRHNRDHLSGNDNNNNSENRVDDNNNENSDKQTNLSVNRNKTVMFNNVVEYDNYNEDDDEEEEEEEEEEIEEEHMSISMLMTKHRGDHSDGYDYDADY